MTRRRGEWGGGRVGRLRLGGIREGAVGWASGSDGVNANTGAARVQARPREEGEGGQCGPRLQVRGGEEVEVAGPGVGSTRPKRLGF
jgi:hypothetical protein